MPTRRAWSGFQAHVATARHEIRLAGQRLGQLDPARRAEAERVAAGLRDRAEELLARVRGDGE